MNTDTLNVDKELVSGDESQFNLMQLRDALYKEMGNRVDVVNDPRAVLYLKMNDCLYRDRDGKRPS